MTVAVEDHGPVRIVSIDRPEVRNAVDGPTARLLYDSFVDFDADDAVSVAVLTGAGGTFCSGADLGAIVAGRGNRVASDPADAIVGSQGPMGPTRLLLDKPVIAAVEGFAVAGGLELALLGRPARGRGRCHVRGVLPSLGRAPDRRRDDPAAPADRSVARARPDPHRPRRRRCGGRADRPGEPCGARWRGARRGDRVGVRDRRACRRPACVPIAPAPTSSGATTSPMPSSARSTLGLATIASGETAEGARRFASGAGRHGKSAT